MSLSTPMPFSPHLFPPKIGIIGGSGLYDIPGLTKTEWKKVETPWGEPSDALLVGQLDGVDVVFLPPHGRGHPIPPTAINYRANIDALKRIGCTEILSISAVGSLREDLSPGTFVVVDQFVDRTFGREKSFFGPGMVAHVSMADPVCARLGTALADTASELDFKHARGGTCLVMEGPQFSTRAESEIYRSWGCNVIGMTAMPEAKLAREAELCYATLAMVTDYDCWHPDHDAVTVEAVIKQLLANADQARGMLRHLLPKLAGRTELCSKGCHVALGSALITQPDARDPALVAKLDAVAGRLLTPA
jgi:5'-methylthioadenosine phosphorylase